MPRICGKDGNKRVSLEDKIKEWKEYEKLLNEKNEWSGEMNIEKMKDHVSEKRMYLFK